MMHDMPKIYWGDAVPGRTLPSNGFLRLDFDKDPLSAIVTLADVIQEFERPTVMYGTVDDAEGQKVTMKYGSACSAAELAINADGTLTICYVMSTYDDYLKKQSFLSKDWHTYFNPDHGYLNMRSLGIRNVDLTVSIDE